MVKCLLVNELDYAQAWSLISSWRDDDARETQMRALRTSERRPYVAIAMIRIAAMLSNNAKVTDGFAEQLSRNAYVYIEEGILNITDQILIALEKDDNPDNEGSAELMEGIPVTFAKQEMAARQAEGY
jgi:hypothetical protein